MLPALEILLSICCLRIIQWMIRTLVRSVSIHLFTSSSAPSPCGEGAVQQIFIQHLILPHHLHLFNYLFNLSNCST